MWRGACTLLIGALAAGLVLTKRRLQEAEAELERLHPTTGATGKGSTEPVASARETAGETEQADVVAGAADLSSEWEQAVAPMDS
jgi:hypothetical protein